MSEKPTIDAAAQSDAIDIVELAMVVWRRRRIVFACAAAGLVLGLLFLHIAPYTYTAQMVIVPIQGSSTSGGRLGGLSSLASMAGISVPQDQSMFQFTLYVQGLRSRAAAEGVSKNQALMRRLYPNEWNAATGQWERPNGSLRWVAKAVKALIGIPDVPYQPPNGARLEQYISQSVVVSEDTKKPVVTVTFDNRDPAFAVAFLDALNKAVDGELRSKALFRSTQNIAYLSEKLKTVTLSEQREAILRALSEQEKSAMMANSTASFAVDTFGPPYQSFRPTSPKPLNVLGMAFAFGAFLGIALAFVAPSNWIERLTPKKKQAAGSVKTDASPAPSQPGLMPARGSDTSRPTV